MAELTQKKFLDKDGVTYLQKKNNKTLQTAVEVIGEELARIEAIKAKSAYDIAVDEGFDGSKEKWLDSLKGPQGESGVYLGEEEPTDNAYNVWIKPSEGENVEEPLIKISQLENDMKYVTESYVETAISKALEVVENGSY